MGDQLALFVAAPDWPEGFRYARDVIDAATEQAVLEQVSRKLRGDDSTA